MTKQSQPLSLADFDNSAEVEEKEESKEFVSKGKEKEKEEKLPDPFEEDEPKEETKVVAKEEIPEPTKKEKKQEPLPEPTEEEEEEEDDKDFWLKVNKLSGEDIEGDFDNTEEGAANYVKSFTEKKLEKYEEYLSNEFPKEYKALQFRMDGIDFSYLYKEENIEDYRAIPEIDDKDTQQQENILYTAHRLRGTPEDDIKDLIGAARDANKLVEKSTNALKFLHKYSEDKINEKESKTKAENEERKGKASEMVNSINELIQKGAIGDFLIPEKDKKALASHVLSSIRYEDGKFMLVKSLTKDQLSEEIQNEYFRFKKGNISDLIERKAKTKLVSKLKSKSDSNRRIKGGGSAEETASSKGYLSLNDFNN